MHAQDWSCPSIHNWDPPSQDSDPKPHDAHFPVSGAHWFEGKIGAKHARMYLNLDDTPPRGLFYILEGDRSPIFFFGDEKPEGFDFSGESQDQKPLGHLQGRFTDKVFLGTWTPHGSDQAEPVRISEVPEMSCAGNGKWKRFDHPEWPFSFSYPASWILAEVKNSYQRYISLTCPDPGDMISQTDVYLAMGTGHPEDLVRCGKIWRYDAECGDDLKHLLYNHVPVSSMRNGMEILDVSGGHEWRAYCRNGGYVGLTEGTSVYVLSGSNWIRINKIANDSNIVERIAKSVRPRKLK
jgi:hypothetical protein